MKKQNNTAGTGYIPMPAVIFYAEVHAMARS